MDQTAYALPGDARLLEFGSGTGGNLPLLARFGRVTAVELSDEARRFSQATAPQVRHAATLEALGTTGFDAPLNAAGFDAAFALDVLEHLEEPRAMLRQIAALLKPGGRLVATVPAHPWLFGEHDQYLHHHRRYTARALRDDLEAGGFRVERLSPMNSALFPVAIAARALEWLRSRVRENAPRPRGMTVPPVPINRLLTELFGAERFLLPARRLPFGLSLLTITARR